MKRILQIISSLLRRLVILCCLVPVSILTRSGRARWERVLHGFLDQGDALAFRTSSKNRLRKFLIDIPLRLGAGIRKHRSILKGFLSLWQHIETPPPSVTCTQPLVCPPQLMELSTIPEWMSNPWLRPLMRAEDVSIADYAHRVLGDDTFAGQTVAVLAHWDPDQRIDPYVRYMLEQFRSLGWKVVLTSSTKPVDDDLPPLDGLVYRTCEGYDFTSWKAALHCFPSLFQAKELILCNDSVFGPLGSYKPMHDAMASLDCDFWGVTFSRYLMPHLQSFYLVIRASALRSPAFADFFRKAPLSNEHTTAVQLELRFALWLERHGLRSAAFASLAPGNADLFNPMHNTWKDVLLSGVPMIKRDLLFKNPLRTDLNGWATIARDSGYPLQLLLTYALRTGVDLTPALCSGKKTGQWPSDVLALQEAVDLNTVDLNALPEKRPPLGIFIHIYYIHLLSELVTYLQHFPQTAHVYVSTDTEEKAAQIRNACAAQGFAVLEVRVLPNRGWDIAPFLLGFADVLEQYPLIVRLHAKQSTQIPAPVADDWRTMLFSSLAGSKDRVHRLEALFAQNPTLGMIVPPPVAWYAANINMAGNLPQMQRLLAPSQIRLEADTAIDFPMGSMFWCRSETLSPWLRQNLKLEDFAPSSDEVREGTLAHALERLFLFGCGIAGLQWGRVAPVGYNRQVPCTKKFAALLNIPAVIPYSSPQNSSLLDVDVTVLPADNRPELVLILPYIRPESFSGGPNTAFLFAAELAKADYAVHCIAEYPLACATERLHEHLRDSLGIDEALVDRFRVSCLDAPITLHENDRIMATAWHTAELAATLCSRLQKKRFIYFIQDFEPLFHPWNEHHARAMLSYGNDFLPVINEHSLAQFCFTMRPGRFADRQFCDVAQVFTPAVDRKYFHPEKSFGRNILLFYARPTHPRNLYHLGMEAISLLVKEGVLRPDIWEIHCMGENSLPQTDFGKGMVSRSIPWENFTVYATRIRQASAGLSLMLSPHTGYMPLELAAAGVPAVTTTYLSKDAACLRELSPDIIGVEPTIKAITDGLREVIRMAEQTDLGEDRLKAPGTWSESFAPIMPRILDFMKAGE